MIFYKSMIWLENCMQSITGFIQVCDLFIKLYTDSILV